MEKNFTHCHGCGLCTVVCPLWHQTRDVAVAPHGHAKALQFGGEINTRALFDCVLCGACEPVCPEDIPIMDLLLGLRRDAVTRGDHTPPAQASAPVASQTTPQSGTLLIADEALLQQQELSERCQGLLNATLATDNGSDIAHALHHGIEVETGRLAAFLNAIKQASTLIVSNGLLQRLIQQWLPNITVNSLGYALSNLPAIQQKLGNNDLYLIESRGYHADFSRMVSHYDELRKSRGCELNLDLQRLAITTGGVDADEAFRSQQAAWLIKGLDISRIVVESLDDGAVMRQQCDLPVVHVAEI